MRCCMAQNPDLIPVDGGPSLRDLELSLTDGAMGARTVRFHFTSMVDQRTKGDMYMVMQVNGLRRIGMDYDNWEVKGVAETPHGRREVVVEYNTKSRFGGVGVYSV
ncbi:MAG TPA: hypothetical protein VJ579_01660 [Candidatus Paceibacterota bacterium]|nr:hypothetical protein [Candidatus Paceibacterota bacterium]